jgi:hypothetical protein
LTAFVVAIPDDRIAEVLVLQVEEIEPMIYDSVCPSEQRVIPLLINNIISIAETKFRFFIFSVSVQECRSFSYLLALTDENPVGVISQ